MEDIINHYNSNNRVFIVGTEVAVLYISSARCVNHFLIRNLYLIILFGI